MLNLIDTFYKVLDEDNYSINSGDEFHRDFSLIVDVLQEVDFLYSRGILEEKELGRFVEIVRRGRNNA